MLDLGDLKHHCRTCFKNINNLSDHTDIKKFIPFDEYPEIRQLLMIFLRKCDDSSTSHHLLDLYIPNICYACLTKWQDFSIHINLALKTDRMLKDIINERETYQSSVLECKEPNEVLIQSETLIDQFEIEKYETVSPFFETSCTNSPVPDDDNKHQKSIIAYEECKELCDMDPDPEDTDEKITSNRNEASNNVEKVNKNKVISKAKRRRKTENKQKANLENHSPESVPRTPLHRPRRSREKTKQKTVETNVSDPPQSAPKKASFRCEPCNKFFYASLTYEGHLKRVHEGVKKAFECKECDKAYSHAHNLIDHISVNHSRLESNNELNNLKEGIQCNICSKTYKNKISLKQHIRNQHAISDVESKRIICDQCGFLAAHQMSLTQHIKNKHSQVEEIKCEECSKTFKSHYYLKYHNMSFHNPQNIKPFKCPQCPMAFTRRPRLNIHIRTHLNYTERIKCDFEGCDVRFVKLSAKRKHMRVVHLKVKQHVCDICGEAFGIKATLRHHRYIHTGEKPYKCTVCGQGFRQFSAMKTHRKNHEKNGNSINKTET